ncbi:hypothetical protein J6590_056819 [Homalodisca vitripennis]|nr:hypothetical protein J6590_056819 [Homalodisca vitripennis]
MFPSVRDVTGRRQHSAIESRPQCGRTESPMGGLLIAPIPPHTTYTSSYHLYFIMPPTPHHTTYTSSYHLYLLISPIPHHTT